MPPSPPFVTPPAQAMPSRLTTLLWALLLALLRGQSDQWIPASNLSAWYSDFDLCLVHSSSNGSIDEISRQCEKQSAPKAPTRCRAGNTWPSQAAYCSAQDLPFSERLSMQRAQQGYDQPSAQPLRSFFGRLAQEGGALLIVGDSVMQQFYSALACELEREGVWTDTSSNGYWPGVKYSHTLRLACTPLADPSPQADWRNRDIERIVSEKGLFMIKIIPFYNLTAPLWDAHPSGHLKDCTHFCWTPMLYQSVFHRMDQGMGEVWNKNPQNP
ncbi:hypothetical protein B484DRAFT_453246 [Ochromonadaceae sp. CCMP2298]|nr:hypothetical protein B484DRAFT_453246 [Ochromonadaceae sp. CCMP2298]